MTDKKTEISDSAIEHARADIVGVVEKYIDLKKDGREYSALCPFHGEKSPSFKVNATKQIYKCFGCGVHGDAIDFVMQMEGLSFPAAVESIVGKAAAGEVKHVKRPRRVVAEKLWRPIARVPDGIPNPSMVHSRLGKPSRTWEYLDADGCLVGYVSRFETMKNGKPGKETLPMCWAVNTETGEMSWQWAAFGVPRPLYNGHKLAKSPNAPVLVVEGEKTADAAQAIFTGFVVVSWPGGSNAVDVADWSQLTGRRVTLWPDWDWKSYPEKHKLAGQLIPESEQVGVSAMRKIYAHLVGKTPSLRFVKPMPDSPDGWDLADPPPAEGWTALDWASKNVVDAAQYFERPLPPPVDADDAPTGPAWGKPLDIFGIQQPPEMPMSVLPPALVDYVRDQSDLTGCDPGIIGLAALVAAAACITDDIKVFPQQRDPTWTESARLWFAVIGDPSTKKSPAISKAVRHVKRIDHALTDQTQKEMADYQWQFDSWKDAKKADKNNPAPEPKKPPERTILVEDATVEALSEVLKDNPRGVLTLKDELTGWFASMDAYKGSAKGASMDRAHWLESYNGGRRKINRITRGSVIVPNWSTCIIGGIQPDMMRRIASSMGNDGLMQRFIVYCARSANLGMDRVPDMRAMERFSALFDQLVSLQAGADNVRMSDGAIACKTRVVQYAHKLIRALDHSHLVAWLGKWEGLYSRLVLLYHVIYCASAGVFPSAEPVSTETADQVEQLLLGILLPHALHFYTEVLDANDRQEHIRQLGRMILAKNLQSISKRDIMTGWKAGRKFEWWEIRNLVESLCIMGWLEPDNLQLDVDGKPRVWMVNPWVHEDFNLHAEREIERRRTALETLRELRDTYMNAPT